MISPNRTTSYRWDDTVAEQLDRILFRYEPKCDNSYDRRTLIAKLINKARRGKYQDPIVVEYYMDEAVIELSCKTGTVYWDERPWRLKWYLRQDAQAEV